VRFDDVDGSLQPVLYEQGESGGVFQDLIGRVGFIRELESNAAGRLVDDAHTYVGVETAGRRVGSGQDLDRPIGESKHAPSLGGPPAQIRGVGLDQPPCPPRVFPGAARRNGWVTARRDSLEAHPERCAPR
jgi:hypothetical protein